MTDLSKVLREEVRQDLMEMAARLQAIADEIDEP